MLPPTWLIVFVAIILLVLGILLFLYLVLSKSRKLAAQKVVAVEVAPKEDASLEFVQFAPNFELAASFRRALSLLRTYVTGSDYRYKLPWFLMIGEAQSGKTTALDNTGLELPLGEVEQRDRQGVGWHFFDRGVVLDVAGDYVLRADGTAPDSRGWNSISRLLLKHRPERPIDGVVLTIPAAELVAHGMLGIDQKIKLQQKAAVLYKRLWQAQKILGMSFPVYVIVTKCDEVVGFKSFCDEIPTHMRDDIFGWSSPYSLANYYQPGWVTEAFQSLYKYLHHLQFEIFAKRDAVKDGDGLFLFPSEMQKMRESAQVYLDSIFKESAFHNSFFFRGLYFCGDGGDEASAATTMPPPVFASEPELTDQQLQMEPDPFSQTPAVHVQSTLRRPIFLRDLFERKIFQEDMLARPIANRVISRNRTVLIAQVVSVAILVIGGLGLLATYGGLKRREKELYEVLDRDVQDLRKVGAMYDRGNRLMSATTFALQDGYGTAAGIDQLADPNSLTAYDGENNLLSAMRTYDDGKFYSLFIPSSWFSGINERIEKSLAGSYKYVVLEALRLDLDAQTNTLLTSSLVSDPLPVPDVYYDGANNSRYASPPVLQTAAAPARSHSEIHRYIVEIGKLQNQRARYERFRKKGAGAPEDLRVLVDYLRHAQIADDAAFENELYIRTRATVEGRPLRTQYVNEEAARIVAEFIEGFFRRSFERRTVRYDYLNDIAQTEALLARPEYTWLATYVFDPRSPFRGMTLTTALRELKKSIEGLSKEQFMSKDGAYETVRARFSARRRLVWDKEPLRKAVALYQEYDAFIRAKPANQSQELDESVRLAAFNQLRGKMVNLVAQAQKYQPAARVPGESSLKTDLLVEWNSLQDAEELLVQVMEVNNRIGIDTGIRSTINGQASYLLRSVNNEFQEQTFYAANPRSFTRWNGNRPLAFLTFDVDNADELSIYLAAQRKDIATLGKLALQVLSFMERQSLRPQMFQDDAINWYEILGELDKFEKKTPGNTVAALENFIRIDMSRVNLDDCEESVRQSNDGGRSTDFFIRKRNLLRRQLVLRCSELAELKKYKDYSEDELKTLKDYNEIADAFNDRLRDRFPFADIGNNLYFAEADPDDVLAFFSMFDKKKESVREGLQRNTQLGASRQQALDFLARMESVRDFFTVFLDKKLGPVIDFNLQFRVNQEREVGVNQIIDWNFDVGKKRFNYRDKEEDLKGRWVFREPLTLTLRWANDSPTVPVAAPTLSRVKVKDRIAVFELKNQWSLLALLIRHAGDPSDFEQGVDTDVYTLKFRVPTQADGAAQPQPREDLKVVMAEIFMRLSLLAPGNKEPLILPCAPTRSPCFPTRAPKLSVPTFDDGNKVY